MQRKIRYRLCEFKYIIYTIIFNYKYFKLNGLLKLPIVFYSPIKLRDMKGKILITCEMRYGLVKIGLPGNEMFQYNAPCIWSDQGGLIIIDGSFSTNPGCSFIIRKNAKLHIYGNTSFGQNLKLLCSKEIIIGKEMNFQNLL